MPTPNVRGLEPAVSTLAHNQGMNRADQDPEVAPKKFWIALHVEHGESTTSNEDQSWQPHQVLSSTQLTRAESIVFEDPVLLAGFAPCCLPNVSAHLELSMSNSAVRVTLTHRGIDIEKRPELVLILMEACERTSMCSKFALAGVHASLERSRTWTRGRARVLRGLPGVRRLALALARPCDFALAIITVKLQDFKGTHRRLASALNLSRTQRWSQLRLMSTLSETHGAAGRVGATRPRSANQTCRAELRGWSTTRSETREPTCLVESCTAARTVTLSGLGLVAGYAVRDRMSILLEGVLCRATSPPPPPSDCSAMVRRFWPRSFILSSCRAGTARR
ncbi:hypothetical protein OH76DRAFT_1522275 [Lentinus brumalis]|uniref:Uncharacterized protein n=1 Tax=Lentinus brumalis TaxID=2498619 RepID=A0A371CH57_9APHY|nr:hypothetical protein OH76DRAFT_1522275 [Polyporus brumalis]